MNTKSYLADYYKKNKKKLRQQQLQYQRRPEVIQRRKDQYREKVGPAKDRTKYFKQWQQANREELKQYQQEYYRGTDAKREAWNEYHRQYRMRNKDKVRALHEKYYKANRDKIIAYQYDYVKANYAKVNKWRMDYRLRRSLKRKQEKYMLRNQNGYGVEFGMVDLSMKPDNVYVVASGPSLSSFNFNSLNGYVITVNDAGKFCRSNAWVTCDPHRLTSPLLDQQSMLPGEDQAAKLYAAVPENYNTGKCPITREHCTFSVDVRVTCVRALVDNNYNSKKIAKWVYRLSEDPGMLAAGNSAFSALNVAYLLNPKRIFLLGVDGSDGYFYSKTQTNKRLGPIHTLFEASVKQLDSKNIKVFNASPTSTVECFTKINLEDLPKYL